MSQKHNEYRFDENDGGNGGDSNVKCLRQMIRMKILDCLLSDRI